MDLSLFEKMRLEKINKAIENNKNFVAPKKEIKAVELRDTNLSTQKKTNYKIDKKFNERQQEAILYDENENLVVMAGAGSGKTSVFVERINFLIQQKNISTENILALTFTEKASEEFKVRLGLDLTFFGTFHSVFFKIIKAVNHNLNYLGYNHLAEAVIYSENRYEYYLNSKFNYAVNEEFKSKQFILKVKTVNKLDEFISDNLYPVMIKSNDFNEYIENMNELVIDKFKFNSKMNLVEEFYRKKIEDKVFSFDDILTHTYFMIKEHEDVQMYVKSIFDNILIDEFQDTNKIVLEIIKMISNDNLFMVGDPLQSIYSFQGADYKHIESFIADMNVIQLDINYRSNKSIIDFTNDSKTLMSYVNENIKDVKQGNDTGDRLIDVYECINDFTIPQFIHDRSKYVELNDICILARNNNHIEEVKDILDKWDIPYNKSDFGEVEHILNFLLLMIFDYRFDIEHKYFKRFRLNQIREIIFHADIETEYDVLTTVKKILDELNIVNYLMNRNYDYESIHNVLNKWEDKILKILFYLDEDKNEYLRNVKLKLEYWLSKENYLNKSGVNIMTIHKSKGLEWDTVILYNFEDGVFPKHMKNEEEKRLFYVSISRAKNKMLITSKKAINSFVKPFIGNDYIKLQVINNQRKTNIELQTKSNDIIKFSGEPIETEFSTFSFDGDTYKYNYQFKNNAKYFIDEGKSLYNKFLKSVNTIILNRNLEQINNYSINDINLMLSNVEAFIKAYTGQFESRELKIAILAIKTNRELFYDIDNNRINEDYLMNDFTDIVHHIINFKNWVDYSECEEYDIKEDEKIIKRFKKIVRNFVSKKHIDIIKSKKKKISEKADNRIDKKVNLSHIKTYEDIYDFFKSEFYKKSEEQKKYYVHNVLGMYDNLNDKMMIDLSDEKFDMMKRDIMIDFDMTMQNGEVDYSFNTEKIKGKFLNDREAMITQKRLAKMKYIEFLAEKENKRCFFLTFTNNTQWHIWKTQYESLKEERKYADNSYLIDNPNFVMQGDNLIEHLELAMQEINKVWNYWYHNYKTMVSDHNKKLKKDKKKKSDIKDYFFTVAEPHKNMTAHRHIAIFIDEEYSEFIYKAMEKTIEQFELNEKFQDIEKVLNHDDLMDNESSEYYAMFNEMLELQSQLQNEDDEDVKSELKETIDNISKKLRNKVSKPTSYIFKYLTKNITNTSDDSPTSEEDMFFTMWKSFLGTSSKIVTSSNYKHTTQKHIDKMYKWYQDNAPHVLKAMKRTGKPIYYLLEKQEINGNFHFDYERRIKENFKTADFIKDVNVIYNLLKSEDLTVDDISDDTNSVDYVTEFLNGNIKDSIENINDNLLNTFKNVMLDDTEHDRKDLWNVAVNFILNNNAESKYLNVYTDKVLRGIYVNKKLIDKYEKTSYVKDIEYMERKWIVDNEKHHLSILDYSVENELDIAKKENAIFETFNDNEYMLIYEEGMYSKGFISCNEIMEHIDFTIDEKYLDKVKNYPNWHENVEKGLQQAYIDTDIDILELMQLVA